MDNNKKQYAVNVKLANGETLCGKLMYDARSLKDRYYTTLEDAERCKQALLERHNRQFNYDDAGNRIETSAVGGIGVDTVIPKEVDERNRIVKIQILVRTVTPWEEAK